MMRAQLIEAGWPLALVASPTRPAHSALHRHTGPSRLIGHITVHHNSTKHHKTLALTYFTISGHTYCPIPEQNMENKIIRDYLKCDYYD